jgi:hypothetical protein
MLSIDSLPSIPRAASLLLILEGYCDRNHLSPPPKGLPLCDLTSTSDSNLFTKSRLFFFKGGFTVSTGLHGYDQRDERRLTCSDSSFLPSTNGIDVFNPVIFCTCRIPPWPQFLCFHSRHPAALLFIQKRLMKLDSIKIVRGDANSESPTVPIFTLQEH